jgi:beta-fructofuranosidase
MEDENGRRLLWGWLWEGRSDQAQQEAGWAGVMSLPRLLSLGSDGLLEQRPVPELSALRGEHVRLAAVDLTPTTADLLAGISGDALEILAEFELANGEAFDSGDVFGLKVRCSPDGTEQTLIVYDHNRQQLAVDRQQSSLDAETHADLFGGPLPLAAGETLKLHIFLDRSVVEVFGNYRTCVASRIYPSRRDSLGVGLFIDSGHVRLKSMDIWSMRSIWS